MVRGAAYLGVANYAVMALGFIKTPILGRLIDPQYWGIFALGGSWVSFVSLFRMELQAVVISDPTHDQSRLVAQWVFETLTALAGFVVAGLLVALLPHIASPLLWQVIFALLGIRLISALTSTPFYILNRDIRQDVLTRLTIIGAILGFIIAVIAAFLRHPLLSLLFDAAIPIAVSGLGAWWVVGWWPSRTWKRDVARDVLSFGFTVWNNGLLGKITFELDDWLVGNLSGTTAEGFYSKAYSLAKMPMDVFAGVIGGIALSMYGQSYAAGRSCPGSRLSPYHVAADAHRGLVQHRDPCRRRRDCPDHARAQLAAGAAAGAADVPVCAGSSTVPE